MSADGQSGIARAVLKAYAAAGDQPLSNSELYRSVCDQLGLDLGEFSERTPVGRSGDRHSRKARTTRWCQQTLKHRHIITRADRRRGVWRLTEEGKAKLHRIERGKLLVAFSTKLGCAVWADARDMLRGLGEPIHLYMTSPPYPLAKPRAYGNPRESEYVDFMCEVLEDVVRALIPGGSVVLNVGQDLFEKNSPARSLYLERLVLALHDRLGLSLMDRWIWYSKSKAPGPVQWASLKRVQLNVAFEPVLWFTNDPLKVRADNRRVLLPHTERHAKLIAGGGEDRTVAYADGAYGLRRGSFSNPTAGRIPRNVLEIGHHCGSQRRYKAAAKALGLPVHGAPFPLALADFAVRFLTQPGELCVDSMSGSTTLGVAAEANGCRWICGDSHVEYLRGGATRYDRDGLWINPLIDQLLGIPSDALPGPLSLFNRETMQ